MPAAEPAALSNVPSSDLKPLWGVLEEEFVALGGTLPDAWDATKAAAVARAKAAVDRTGGLAAEVAELQNEKLLPLVRGLIHARAATGHKRSALCFSGGGIRSATFNLGVLQRLAELDLLKRFDYLSTVSGGGYLGGWLTGWIHRHPDGLAGVVSELVPRSSATSANPTATAPAATGAASTSGEAPAPAAGNVGGVEPPPLRHLRTYSRYLSPNVGLFSADTWTLAAIYVRNLLLNWLVLVPLLAAALVVPRFCVAFVAFDPQRVSHTILHALRLRPWFVNDVLLALGLVLAASSFIYAALYQPSAWAEYFRRQRAAGSSQGASSMAASARLDAYGQAQFIKLCLVPLLLAGVCLSTYWVWDETVTRLDWEYLLAFGVVLGVVGWGAAAAYDGRLSRFRELPAVLVAGLGAGAALCGSAYLLDVVAPYPQAGPYAGPYDAYYACLAFPLTLASLGVGGILYVGLVSRLRDTRDEDREWWARYGAWLLIAVVAWLLLAGLVIYGPAVLLWGTGWARGAIASAGGLAGAATLLLGRSAATPANRAQGEKADGWPALASRIGLAVAAPLFAALLVAGVSLATSGLLTLCRPDRHLSSPADHFAIMEGTSLRLIFCWMLALVAFGLVMSRALNLNKFSLHGMYRDRLVRAYLGASRAGERKPDRFTGFDPRDNVAMFHLRPEVVREGDLTPGHPLVRRLAKVAGAAAAAATASDSQKQTAKELLASDPASTYLVGRLPADLREALAGWSDPTMHFPRWLDLLDALNRLLLAHDFSTVPAFSPVAAAGAPAGRNVPLRNRLLLEAVYPAQELVPLPEYRSKPEAAAPLHVVNVALNLVSGKDPAWQERKAESFTVSSMHSGSGRLGYRDSCAYGGDRGISLGTAVTISGAAVSPNMGYHSSKAIAFLLTLFNVRLGWSLGNPGVAGEATPRRWWEFILGIGGKATYPLRSPELTIEPLLAEAFGLTDDEHRNVYLSDGGHFENLGLYEMVSRRCHVIVLGDAGGDPACAFEDLGNAIRKIRVDQRVSITFPAGLSIYSRDAKKSALGRYCAVGEINYRDADGEGAVNGVLLYLKPAFYGLKEPVDVFNYASGCEDFPHESTADQFFSESQFESYRALGYYTMQQVGGEADDVGGLENLLERASKHARPDPRPAPPPASPCGATD